MTEFISEGIVAGLWAIVIQLIHLNYQIGRMRLDAKKESQR